MLTQFWVKHFKLGKERIFFADDKGIFLADEPVANATINIIDYNMISTTDADGCYVLDELVSGTYLVHCYANNYQVPEAVTLTAEAGESLMVDFSLTPAVTEEPTSA